MSGGETIAVSGGETFACAACGHVYDEAAGDPARNVPPGLRFDRLPDYWRCPGCGGPQHGFTPPGGPAETLEQRVAALLAVYRRVWAEDMGGTLICNPALSVEAVGFRPYGPGWFGVVVSPWFLNGVLIPADRGLWAGLRDGDGAPEQLPTGTFNFIAARVGALGTVKTLAVVSAMNVFSDQAEALAAAEMTLAQLFPVTAETPAEAAPIPAKPAAGLSRRALFGRGEKSGDA